MGIIVSNTKCNTINVTVKCLQCNYSKSSVVLLSEMIRDWLPLKGGTFLKTFRYVLKTVFIHSSVM